MPQAGVNHGQSGFLLTTSGRRSRPVPGHHLRVPKLSTKDASGGPQLQDGAGPGTESDGSPRVRILLRQAAQDQGYPAGIMRKHGTADSRFFRQRGIATVIFGIGGDGQRGPSEYVDITTIKP